MDDKLEEKYLPFFEKAFMETKFEDANFYYDEFINFDLNTLCFINCLSVENLITLFFINQIDSFSFSRIW